MKKGIAILCTVLAAASLALAGCGSGGSETPQGGNETPQGSAGSTAQATKEAEEFVFVYNGTEIPMKADAKPILEALGEAKSYNEEKSCAFDGLDKTYFYGSFYLYTYPQGEDDYVNMVELFDDTVQTKEGLAIGDSKEKVEELYGADSFNGTNAYIINAKDSSLTIILDKDKVSSIQYAAIQE